MFKNIWKGLFWVICLSCSVESFSQKVDFILGEDNWEQRAETKQVNQFFKRFNGEEDENGKRFNPSDRLYRSHYLRRNYVPILFDNQTPSIDQKLKIEFTRNVVNKDNPIFLDFHKDGWFSEVECNMEYKGELRDATLFFKLEQERLGYKWVLQKVFFEPLNNQFSKENIDKDKFLHPLSHELAFMNLNRVFTKPEEIVGYTEKDFSADILTLFLFEVKNNRLKFGSVSDIKFHFFQVDDWYFELKEFNRAGGNSGWLISSLAKIPEDEKHDFMKFIYFQ